MKKKSAYLFIIYLNLPIKNEYEMVVEMSILVMPSFLESIINKGFEIST